MASISLWLCLLIPGILSSEKVFKVELKDINKQRGLISVCLGSPFQCLPFKVSNEISVSFVLNGSFYPKGFQWAKSKSFITVEKNKSLQYKTQKMEGSYFKDYLQIETTPIQLKDLELFMVDSGFLEEGIAGVLGLSVVDKLPNRTFMQSTFQQKFIQNYGVQLSQKKGIKNFIQFGLSSSTIDEIAFPEKYEKRAKICRFTYEKEKHLNCDLAAVIYYYEKSTEPPVVIPGNIPLFLNNELDVILCPYYFFRLLTETILKPQIARKECKIAQRDNTQVILCNPILSADITGEFYFVVDKWSIKYSIRDLFVPDKEGMVFLMRNSDQNKNYWMLGRSLLDKHDLILDYEMELVYLR